MNLTKYEKGRILEVNMNQKQILPYYMKVTLIC